MRERRREEKGGREVELEAREERVPSRSSCCIDQETDDELKVLLQGCRVEKSRELTSFSKKELRPEKEASTSMALRRARSTRARRELPESTRDQRRRVSLSA